jgi:molybdate transport system substrate-binding protein
MSRSLLVLLAAGLILVGSFVMLARTDTISRPDGNAISGDDRQVIVLFCAASNRAVMEAIRQDYELEYGRSVQIQYGASQTLLSSIEVSGTGDLYLPADESFIELAREKSLIAETIPIAAMNVVVAVRRGNPKSIKTFDDLLRDDVQLVQASPDAAAIGKLTRTILTPLGLWQKLDAATDAYRTTVTDIANDLVANAADAAIVYDAVLHTYPDLTAVQLPEFESASSQISIGVIASTKNPQAALHFARYAAARDRGQKRYAEHGYQIQAADVWSDVPELSLFAGSMLRPAIEDTIVEFEQREGVRVSRVYNGCGILVAQMKAGQLPDAYFACDTEFMNQVPDLFPEPINVSQNELIILVQKGNPHQLASLKDLGRPGLKVGIGHEKQCAMGWLTQNTFREGGVQKEVMANVTVQTPTGDMLVNQLLTGSLDAAVVYLSNAAGAGEKLDAVQIQGLECSVATQPFAISPSSANAQTASRLFQRITNSESQVSFVAEGFRWDFGSQRPTTTSFLPAAK